MSNVEAAGITDVGKKRKGNEDNLLLDVDMQLYVVADGMGGHRAGEVASRLVVDSIREFMKGGNIEGTSEEENHPDTKLSKEGNRLLASIHHANREVNRLSTNEESCKGMGSTVSAVRVTDDVLVAANVGDSPIYLVRDGGIRELSVPHTVLAEQEALYPGGVHLLGEMYRHMLTRAVGVHEMVKPDACEIPCRKGDIAVICSDGLSNKVSPDEILQVVSRARPEKACRLLVNLANERGGDDNVTVVVVRIGKRLKKQEKKQEPAGTLTGRLWAALRTLIPEWL